MSLCAKYISNRLRVFNCYRYSIITSSSLGYRASLGVSPHISGICHSNKIINLYITLIIESHQYYFLTNDSNALRSHFRRSYDVADARLHQLFIARPKPTPNSLDPSSRTFNTLAVIKYRLISHS